MRRLPLSGALFLGGFFAITGTPMFGPFISEFAILSGALSAGRYVTAGLFLLLLMMVFIGMGATVLRAIQGVPSTEAYGTPYRDGLFTGAPVVAFMAMTLLLGIYIPAPLRAMLIETVHFLGDSP
jgi:hydrogenase-4 component F